MVRKDVPEFHCLKCGHFIGAVDDVNGLLIVCGKCGTGHKYDNGRLYLESQQEKKLLLEWHKSW